MLSNPVKHQQTPKFSLILSLLDFAATPERTLCIHEHGLPHGLCPYPCPYANYQMSCYMDSLDLSDILDYEDYMVTSSNEDIPAFEDTPY